MAVKKGQLWYSQSVYSSLRSENCRENVHFQYSLSGALQVSNGVYTVSIWWFSGSIECSMEDGIYIVTIWGEWLMVIVESFKFLVLKVGNAWRPSNEVMFVKTDQCCDMLCGYIQWVCVRTVEEKRDVGDAAVIHRIVGKGAGEVWWSGNWTETQWNCWSCCL